VEDDLLEWDNLSQLIVDWIEEDKVGSLTLLDVSERLGYSPYYCSRKFHQMTGQSIREYAALRRISRIAMELRSTDRRVIDIDFEYGFGSHEALTRAFVSTFDMTPRKYRNTRTTLPLVLRRTVSSSQQKPENGRRNDMGERTECRIDVSIEFIPSHFFVGIRDIDVNGYWEFWSKRQDCEELMGTLESISDEGLSSVPRLQLGGWYTENGRQGYLYGILVRPDYRGDIPEQCEKILIPAGDYVCFRHPVYNYATEEESVRRMLKNALDSFQAPSDGFLWADKGTRPTWQRHLPEEYGQAILKPVDQTDPLSP
jgi:AraC family transcriptional regulator